MDDALFPYCQVVNGNTYVISAMQTGTKSQTKYNNNS